MILSINFIYQHKHEPWATFYYIPGINQHVNERQCTIEDARHPFMPIRLTKGD